MVNNIVKNVLKRFHKEEKGYALVFVLVFLLFGGLVIPPLLSYMNTGLKTGIIYKENQFELYAADAGINDSLWHTQYGDLQSLLGASYDEYDYNSEWSYNLSENVNGKETTVTFQNSWIPQNIPVPHKVLARDIIEAGKLIVAGSAFDASTYEIKIIFYPDAGDDLLMETVGIWLPPGFEYIPNSSNLESNPADPYYTTSVQITSHAGGEAVVWSFSYVPYLDFPGVDSGDMPMTSTITLQYTSSQPGMVPAAVSWVTTSQVDSVPYAWDADTRVFKVVSRAGDAEVEAYTVKSELRHLGSAISGDYFAFGNTLLTPTGSVNYRNRLYEESIANVVDGDIPDTATIRGAYLYWSGWIDWVGFEPAVLADDCSEMSGWIPESDWQQSGGRFIGHRQSAATDKYLTKSPCLDLSSYTGSTVYAYWDQEASSPVDDADYLYFSFSADDGDTWSGEIEAFHGNDPESPFSYIIPNEYLTTEFSIRFRLDGFSETDEYCYLDNITITPLVSLKYPTDPTYENLRELVEDIARVNRVMFNDIEVVADEWHIVETENPPGYDMFDGQWSYSCYYDATDDVLQLIEDEDIEDNGVGAYTVGHVVATNEYDPDYAYNLYPIGETGYPLGTPAHLEGASYPSRHQAAYTGWSLILVYTSPDTKGHQLFLYDDFVYAWHTNPDFDNNGSPGGSISGFLVPDSVTSEAEAARVTVFAGEGDEGITGDYIKVNLTSLSNSASPVGNAWNSASPGLTIPGVDIDTFAIEYPVIAPGDTDAVVDLPTDSDGFFMVYIILSFRSEVTSGGVLTYLIRD